MKRWRMTDKENECKTENPTCIKTEKKIFSPLIFINI